MAKAVTIGEAKTNFSKLVRQAEAGEEIVVRRGRDPVARIMPLEKRGGVHGFGSMKGEIRVGGDFDEPLEDFAPYE
jgi:prevent-host-death family protein